MSEPLRIWDTRTGKLTLELKLSDGPKHGSAGGQFAVAPNGMILATHAYDKIVMHQLVSGTRIATLPLQTTGYISEFAFSPDGDLLASIT